MTNREITLSLINKRIKLIEDTLYSTHAEESLLNYEHYAKCELSQLRYVAYVIKKSIEAKLDGCIIMDNQNL